MLESFYRAVLPDTGHFCLFLLPEARHVWADSIEGLISLTEKYIDRQGVYFATESFKGDEARTQANVLALKSFRFDIDAGEKKYAKDPDGTYPDQHSALAALVGFVRATQLAPSYIVSSGEGLHVYFCLDEAVGPDEWFPVARGLGELAKQHGLKLDSHVTCDSARILRPLGTPHKNGSRVSVLRGTGRVFRLQDLVDACPVEPLAPARKYDTSINDEAISTFEGPPSSALKIAANCGAMGAVATAKGDVQEPFWRAMLGVVKHTVEGDELAHEWSMGYDGYDERETQRKLDAWATGPTTCAEFSKHSKACQSCPHRGNIKSPIVLGRMTSEQIEQLPEEKKPVEHTPTVAPGLPWDGQLGPGFDIIKAKGSDQWVLVHWLEVERENELGEMVPVKVQVPITHELFWFSYWADATAVKPAQITISKWDAMERFVKTYDIPAALLASRADLAKALSGLGIQITTDKRAPQALEAYTKMQFQRIRDLSRRPMITDRFGLRVMDDGTLAALHGKYLIRSDGTIQEAMLGEGLRSYCERFRLPLPQGNGSWEPDAWDYVVPYAQEHVQFMRNHYSGPGLEKYRLAFMLGLASPLMAFVTGGYVSGSVLPPNGVTVSLYEREGGKGKTTLMQALMLAFGSPEELTRDQNRQGSTDLARVAKLSLLGTMPASFDEMGRMGEKTAADLVSIVANGAGRERATKDGGLVQGTQWSLVCIAATNRSQRDMIAVAEEDSSAVQFRLLELDVSNSPDFDRDARKVFTEDWSQLKLAAGALGAVIQREICKLSPVAANKLVMDCVNKAADLVEADKEDRFQYRALGAMLALQIILRRIGMEMFDTKELLATFRNANESAKAYIAENTLPNDGCHLLARALHDLRPKTLVTQDTGWLKGRVKKPARVIGQVPIEVAARYIADDTCLYVSVEALKAWCRDHKVRPSDILTSARNRSVLKPIYDSRRSSDSAFKASSMFNLYTGVEGSVGARVNCHLFHMDTLAKIVGEGLMEDGTPYEEQEGGQVIEFKRPEETAA